MVQIIYGAGQFAAAPGTIHLIIVGVRFGTGIIPTIETII
jgi:hypothetical protein